MTDETATTTGFSGAEYRRRWSAATQLAATLGVDAIVATAPASLGYLAGTNGGIHWTTPMILATGQEPLWVVRRFDEARVRVESPVPRLAVYFGEDDVIDVWADAVRSLGLSDARLGLELDRWGVAPADVDGLRQRLPGLTIVDITHRLSRIAAVKSAEEVAAMRRAMALTETGMEAFYGALVPGATETDVTLASLGALLHAGSEMPSYHQVTLGDRTALPHARLAQARGLRAGDVAFAEFAGFTSGYAAALVRSAVIGGQPRAEALHAVAEEALMAAIAQLRPGHVTGDAYVAARRVIEGAGLGTTQRARVGYVIGYDWGSRGDLSLKPGGTDVIEQGMTFHLPTILFHPDGFSAGCSETVLVGADGPELLSRLPRAIRRV